MMETPSLHQTTIEQLIEGLYDGPHATPPVANDGAIFLGIDNLTNDGHIDLSRVRRISEDDLPAWTKRVVPRAGDLVFSYEATLHRYALIPEGFRGCLGRRMALLRMRKDRVDGRYLLYHFFGRQWRETVEANILTGATVNRVPISRFPKFPIALPDLAIQRRIASVLSAYDDLIENNEKRIGILEEMARALYREWFFLSDSSVSVARPTAQRLIDDGVLEINDGYRAKNTDLGSPGLPFARAGNIDDGFHLSGAETLHEANVPRAGAKISREGDVVFTSKGTVGRFAWVRPTTPRFVYSPQLCFWRVLQPEVLSSRYLYRWMKSPAFVMQLNRVKSSTDMADYVSLTDQRRMIVDVPSPELQRRADAVLAPVDDMVDNLRERNTLLRTTRDLLLPRLISGELDVSRVPDPASL